MNEALDRHEKERTNSTVRWEILEYLAYSTFMQGKYRDERLNNFFSLIFAEKLSFYKYNALFIELNF